MLGDDAGDGHLHLGAEQRQASIDGSPSSTTKYGDSVLSGSLLTASAAIAAPANSDVTHTATQNKRRYTNRHGSPNIG